MIDRNLQKLKYETGIHHRQNLRSQLDQGMIDQIEISSTPSLNYQMAYKSLYHDQLQKSVQLHDKKKNLEQTKKAYDILVSNQHQNIYKTGQIEPLKNSLAAINVHNLNYRDVDYMNYDLLKETKALDHTLKNYDGGQGFYKNCDAHLVKQKMQQQNMRRTLLKQLNQKQQRKMSQMAVKREQQGAIRCKQNLQHHYKNLSQASQMQEKVKRRDEMLGQIQEQRVKRGRRSVFSYNNLTRHNPITNPIQYHIDNPYILKQIQAKNQSLY